MDDLTAFIAARLDEDEAAAHAWLPFGNPDAAQREHIARKDPGRVLREVAAKRAILARHKPHETMPAGLACNWCSDDVDDRPQLMKMDWPCPDVRAIAAVWSDHPDYRSAWSVSEPS